MDNRPIHHRKKPIITIEYVGEGGSQSSLFISDTAGKYVLRVAHKRVDGLFYGGRSYSKTADRTREILDDMDKACNDGRAKLIHIDDARIAAIRG